MSTAKAIAEKYGLKTAVDIAPPAPAAPRWKPIKWSLPRRLVFNALRPVALSLVATDGPVTVTEHNADGSVKRRFGHNRSVWPARLVNSAAQRDTATTIWDRNPTMKVHTQFRVWVLTEPERARLTDKALDFLAMTAGVDGGLEPLDHGFLDFGPDLSLARLETSLHDIARRHGIATWDDEGLAEWFDSINTRARQICADKGWKLSEKLMERVAQGDVDQWSKAR